MRYMIMGILDLRPPKRLPDVPFSYIQTNVNLNFQPRISSNSKSCQFSSRYFVMQQADLWPRFPQDRPEKLYLVIWRITDTRHFCQGVKNTDPNMTVRNTGAYICHNADFVVTSALCVVGTPSVTTKSPSRWPARFSVKQYIDLSINFAHRPVKRLPFN